MGELALSELTLFHHRVCLKSLGGLHGIRAHGRRMVGADETYGGRPIFHH